MHPTVQRATLRQLLTHTSGLRDSHEVRYQFSGTSLPVSSDELLSLYRELDDLNAEPGTTWNYNNGGYLLATTVIERVCGQSLEEVLQRRIFAPAGLNDTRLRRLDSDFVPNSATLHMTRPGGGFEKSYLATALCGEGGVVSTVDDMLRWLACIDSGRVVSPRLWQLMTTPQVLSNGTSTGYGLGLMHGRYRGVETIAHAGGVMGGNSQMLIVPAVGLQVIVLVNRHDVSAVALTNKILDVCLADQGLEPVAEQMTSVPQTGTFHSRRSGRTIQLFERRGRQFACIDGTELPFEPGADGALYPTAAIDYLKYRIAPRGVDSMQFDDFGTSEELVALRPAAADHRPPVGFYESVSTGTRVMIEESNDGPMLRSYGRFGTVLFRLECLGCDVWRATSPGMMPWGGILSFTDDRGSFHFSSGRTRALPFRRCD